MKAINFLFGAMALVGLVLLWVHILTLDGDALRDAQLRDALLAAPWLALHIYRDFKTGKDNNEAKL